MSFTWDCSCNILYCCQHDASRCFSCWHLVRYRRAASCPCCTNYPIWGNYKSWSDTPRPAWRSSPENSTTECAWSCTNRSASTTRIRCRFYYVNRKINNSNIRMKISLWKYVFWQANILTAFIKLALSNLDSNASVLSNSTSLRSKLVFWISSRFPPTLDRINYNFFTIIKTY